MYKFKKATLIQFPLLLRPTSLIIDFNKYILPDWTKVLGSLIWHRLSCCWATPRAIFT